MGVLLKLMFLCLGLFVAAFAVGQVFRNARRLDRRIAQFKAEQKALEEQGRTVHPYLALSELYTEEGKAKDKKRVRRGEKETRRR